MTYSSTYLSSDSCRNSKTWIIPAISLVVIKLTNKIVWFILSAESIYKKPEKIPYGTEKSISIVVTSSNLDQKFPN